MASQQYDETEAIKSYVWRNYPEISRPHECLADGEAVIRLLPERLKTVYRESLKQRELNAAITGDDAAIIMAVLTQLETERFFRMVDVNSLHIARCPKCQKVLVNEKSRQCLHCGFDWH